MTSRSCCSSNCSNVVMVFVFCANVTRKKATTHGRKTKHCHQITKCFLLERSSTPLDDCLTKPTRLLKLRPTTVAFLISSLLISNWVIFSVIITWYAEYRPSGPILVFGQISICRLSTSLLFMLNVPYHSVY